jgi:hypothetical protein
MNQNLAKQVSQVQSIGVNALWRWAVSLVVIATLFAHPITARAEENTVDAAGDTGWYISTVRTGAETGYALADPSIAIDPLTGRAFIAYIDENEHRLLIAYEWPTGGCPNNSQWRCIDPFDSNIDNNGRAGQSLDFDLAGNLFVLYSPIPAGIDSVKLLRMEANLGSLSQSFPTPYYNPNAVASARMFGNLALRWWSTANANSWLHSMRKGTLIEFSFATTAAQNGGIYPIIETESVLDGFPGHMGRSSSMGFGANGLPVVSYMGGGAAQLKVATPTSGASNCTNTSGKNPAGYSYFWQCAIVDPGNETGYNTSIHVTTDAGDFTRIAYFDRDNQTLKLAEYVGGDSTCGAGGSKGWRCSVIDSIGDSFEPIPAGVQLLVQDGRAVIVYHDENDSGVYTGYKLKIARQLPAGEQGNCGPSDGFIKTWKCSVIDSGAKPDGTTINVKGEMTAAVDKLGRVVVAYMMANGDMMVAKEKFVQPLLFTKEYGAASIPSNGATHVVFTLGNPHDEAVSDISFMDFGQYNIAFGQIAENDCGGSTTTGTGLGGYWFKLTGGVLPVKGQCKIKVAINGLNPGALSKATSPVTSREVTATPGALTALTITQPKQAQSIDFPALPNRTLGDAPFGLAATASSGLPVGFTSATASVCAVNGASVTVLAAGQCTITADQPGDAAYSAAAPVSQSFNVAQANQGINFPALPNRTVGDAPFNLVATASSGLPVSFASNTPAICTVSGATVTLVAAGQCTISADQAGDANFSAALTVSQSFSVAAAGQPADPSLTIKVFLPVVQR